MMKSFITSICLAWRAFSLCFASLLVVGVPAANGQVLHRYFLSEKSEKDLVGQQHGQLPPSAEFDAVEFSEDVPEKGSGVSLDLSQVGDGKISGIVLDGPVLNAEKGAYSLWIKPAQEVEGQRNNYIITSTPMKDGITLVLRSGARVLVHAQGKNIGPVALTPRDAWHHVAVVWDAANDSAEANLAELFIDGEPAGSATLEGPVKAKEVHCGTYHLKYGFDNSGQSYAASQYRGLIYDLQIYGDSLTAGQVKKLYENPGLALDEISGNSQPDSHQ